MADDHVQYHSAPEQWAKLKQPAQRMRQYPTSAEAILWEHLRDRQLENAKFRRQHPIGHFVVDFFCWSAKLVIEIDGDIHDQRKDEDVSRQAYIEAQGFRVIRFKNQDVFDNLESVLQNIAAHISSAPKAPSPNGEGVGG